MRKFLTAFVLAGAMLTAGCTSGGFAGFGAAVTTKTPTQARTVAEATLAATIAEKMLLVYVQSGKADPAVLRQLRVLVPAVHNALVRVQVANKNGDSALTAAALGAFNEALAALNSYSSLKGVPQ
jgi:hypothetical protein